jgi:class 3 adenylate cyclase
MVKMPLAMGQAISQHSNVIRRAAWTHYGFVVGQEGDSFVLAFRDASDAVAFCLQVSPNAHGWLAANDTAAWWI